MRLYPKRGREGGEGERETRRGGERRRDETRGK